MSKVGKIYSKKEEKILLCAFLTIVNSQRLNASKMRVASGVEIGEVQPNECDNSKVSSMFVCFYVC
jgi:hypothetical protein